ncbi:MAG: PDZ domain-containing protein [Myxococcota bacterium]
MQRRNLLFTAGLVLSVGLLWSLWPTSADPSPGGVPPSPGAEPPHLLSGTPGVQIHRSPLLTRDPTPEDTGEVVEDEEPVVEEGHDTGAPPPFATLQIQVVENNGLPVEDGMVVSTDCDIWRMLGEDGWVSVEIPADTACRIQGRRRDGLLWGRSDWYDLIADAGEVIAVELVVPEEQTGGLGVAIREHDDGIEVERVWPNTPAAEMGLRPGDVIVEVDGLEAAALSMDDFVEVMTGPVGSEVEFVVADLEADTGLFEEVLVLERAWLTP